MVHYVIVLSSIDIFYPRSFILLFIYMYYYYYLFIYFYFFNESEFFQVL